MTRQKPCNIANVADYLYWFDVLVLCHRVDIWRNCKQNKPKMTHRHTRTVINRTGDVFQTMSLVSMTHPLGSCVCFLRKLAYKMHLLLNKCNFIMNFILYFPCGPAYYCEQHMEQAVKREKKSGKSCKKALFSLHIGKMCKIYGEKLSILRAQNSNDAL